IFSARNHDYLLFFTQKGKVYWMRVFEVPEGSKVSKGRAVQNLINIEKDDKIKAILATKNLKDKDYVNAHYVIMATKKGTVKKTSLEQYSRPRQSGINAITIREGDELLDAKLTTGDSHIMLAVKSGKAIRFEESKTRPMGRTASGVRGISLADENDEVVGMISVQDLDSDVFVVSEKGYGKRSKVKDYRLTNRGGKGVKTINITDKTGKLVAIKNVKDGDDLMIITKNGLTIRFSVDDIRQMGRAAQGVRAIHLREGDEIASVAKIAREDDMDDAENSESAFENQQDTENGTPLANNQNEEASQNGEAGENENNNS
ncbi:MAG: DNA gyrase subunit A, partial [Chlorobi bacterium]|nr:DNA gyrase subunit A [Chlorobiota bacterium]